MIRWVLTSLVRFKNHLRRQDQIAAYCDGYDEEAEARERQADLDDINNFDEDADGAPLTWAEQKNVRLELRRYLTWHALRLKVPRRFEEGA